MMNTKFQQLDIEQIGHEKTFTKKKIRPCVSNICTTFVFVVFMAGTALLSNSFHYLPDDTVEIVEGSGKIHTMFSFVPFWSEEEITMFYRYNNVLVIPSFIHDNKMYKMCTLLYNIHSFADFAEQFASKNLSTVNEFARVVIEYLSHNFTVGNNAIYTITTMRCLDKTDIFEVAAYLTSEMSTNNGSSNTFISRFLYNDTLYKDCSVKYKIHSINAIIQKFMHEGGLIGFMDEMRSDMISLLEINKTASTPEYQVFQLACIEEPVCNYTAQENNRNTPRRKIVEIELTVDVGIPDRPYTPVKNPFRTDFNDTRPA